MTARVQRRVYWFARTPKQLTRRATAALKRALTLRNSVNHQVDCIYDSGNHQAGQRQARKFAAWGVQKREDTAMNKQTTKRAVAVAVVGAVMLGSVPPSGAAPISSSMAILKQAARRLG